MTTELISRCLTPGKHLIGIWSLISLRGITSPCAIQSSTPNKLLTEANPKAISRRTSYLRFRLEFLRYPQVITYYFNRSVFGPPRCVTTASTCSWIGQSVSGLCHATKIALFKLAFATAPWLYHLTSQHIVTRRPVLQKVRGHTCLRVVLPLLVSIRFQVLFHSPPGVLFTFPSRYYTLSVTRSYLAL